MENDKVFQEAQNNLLALRSNPYPGRGFVVGMDRTGTKLLQLYWLMGRGDDSRNRIFVDQGNGRLFTAIADPSRQPEDTSLIIYCAMEGDGGFYVASNGHQTGDIFTSMMVDGKSHYESVQKWQYEPDAPNFTPRITATFLLREFLLEISILKKSPFGQGCDRQVFRYQEFTRQLGHCITTYEGDGKPLPSFRGEPYILPLRGETVEEVAEILWNNLNPDNRVALAIKAVDLGTKRSVIHIINKYPALS